MDKYPFFPSLFEGLERITKTLIDNGANVDIRSDEGRTPLEIAAVNGNLFKHLKEKKFISSVCVQRD